MIGNLFRLISLTKQRKYTIPSKFPVFRGEVQKVFWNTTLFCRQWFRLLSALIFKSFFSKATISWQYKCFSVDKFTKIGRKYDSCLEKKSCQLWQKSKAFSFPSKANTVRDKKTFMCHEYIKNCVKNLFEASVAFSQPKSFTSAHKVYTCFYNHFCILHKDLFYVSFVGQD